MAKYSGPTDLAKLADRFTRKLGPDLGKACLRAGFVVRGAIVKEIASWTSKTSGPKSGALMRSFVLQR
jgi:hypothetical protein